MTLAPLLYPAEPDCIEREPENIRRSRQTFSSREASCSSRSAPHFQPHGAQDQGDRRSDILSSVAEATTRAHGRRPVGCAKGVGADALTPITALVLPSPPSVNALFRNKAGVGRVKTALYDRWAAEATWRLREQRPAAVHGPCMVLIGVERTNSRADIDNRIKPLLDLLVANGVIDDDSQVVGVAAAWSPARDGLARIAIRPAADAAVRFHLAPDGAHGGWMWTAPEPTEEAA